MSGKQALVILNDLLVKAELGKKISQAEFSEGYEALTAINAERIFLLACADNTMVKRDSYVVQAT